MKALRKPTLAAWLANQLVGTDPDQVNDLTELGDQLREAHLSADGPRGRSPRCFAVRAEAGPSRFGKQSDLQDAALQG